MPRQGELIDWIVASSCCLNDGFCVQPSPDAKQNLYPVNTAPPKPYAEVKNGKAFQAGEEGFEFWIIHLYGTPYEMGYAQGAVLGLKAAEFFNSVWDYLLSQVTDELSGIPTWLADDIANFGLDVAMDLTGTPARVQAAATL